jgi:NitT/TauT family transport system substrate-binding protein
MLGGKMSTWSFRVAPLVAAGILVLAGCTTAPSGATFASVPSGGLEQPDITVAAVPSADLAGLYIAQDNGLFAKVGLHVTIKKIAGSQAVIAAQLKGQVDISAGAYVAYILAQAAGARFRILAEASTLGPHTRVLLTTAGSRITTLAGLVGKKIAVNGTGSIGTLLISALLAEYDISPAKVTFVTDPDGFPAMPAELQDGAWSAAFLAEPYVTLAGEDYGERELADRCRYAPVRPARHAIYRRSSAGNSGQIDDQPRLLSLLARGPATRGPATRDQLRGAADRLGAGT